MDLRLAGLAPSAAERGAPSTPARPADAAWTAAPRRRPRARRRPRGPAVATCCCPALHAVHDAVGLDQPGRPRRDRPPARGRAGRRLRRGLVLRACSRWPSVRRRVVHVCTDLACQAGPAGLSALRTCARAAGPARRPAPPSGPKPLPRPVRTGAGRARRWRPATAAASGRWLRPRRRTSSAAVAGAVRRPRGRGPPSTQRSRRPAIRRLRPAAAGRRGRSGEPRRLPAARRLRGAAAGGRARARPA